MANEEWDAIVIGAGIEGSATAYTFAKHGKRTLLLEQFLLPHTRGSSHGASRITRKAYDKEAYISMMVDAFPMWEKLEQETNTNLYKKTGLLVIDKPPYHYLGTSINAFKKLKVPFKEYGSEDLKKEFPMLKVPSEYKGCLDMEGGTLKADKALQCYQRMFVQFGGTLHDGEPVKDIFPGNIVTVFTSKGSYKTHSLVITAGPWASSLLKPLGVHLPLRVAGINVCYWKIKDGCYKSFLHAFIDSEATITLSSGGKVLHTYGLPADEYPNCFKLCIHGGYDVDPDKRDEAYTQNKDIEILREYVREHFLFLEDKPCIVEKCMYTITPDDDPVLDRHPSWKNIVYGAGFSGHGFKLAPVVGKILFELATDKQQSYDLSLFKQDRFIPKSAL